MESNQTTSQAAQRRALAREVGARIGADPATAAFLVRAADQTSRALGQVQDTPAAARRREGARRARVQAVIDAMGGAR